MGRTLLVAVVFGLLIVLFALTRVFWLNALLLFAAGACMVMVFAMLSSLVQLNAPNEMRGRVMSIYMVAFRGGMPLGSLAAGWMATLDRRPVGADGQRRALNGRGGMVPAQEPRREGTVDEWPMRFWSATVLFRLITAPGLLAQQDTQAERTGSESERADTGRVRSDGAATDR